MTRRPIGPLEIRRHIVSVYITQGLETAKPLAAKYGYRAKYISQMARNMIGRHLSVFYKHSRFVEFESFRFDPRFIVRTTHEAHQKATHRPQASAQDCQA
jgi:hypothetical protein